MDAAELAAVQARLDASLPYDDEASTITVVVGLTVMEVLEAFGGDPAVPLLSQEETWEHDYDDAETVALFEFPGGVVAVEFNGYEGRRAEVLRRASARGRAASMYWNINTVNSLSLAEAGVVLYSEEVRGTVEVDGPALAPLFAGLDFGWESRLASAITVIERFTGVRIEGPRPPEPLMLHRLAPHLRDRPRGEPTPEAEAEPYRYHHMLSSFTDDFGALGARQLVEGVRAATVPVRRKVAAYAVGRALRAAGLETHPDVAATLATLDAAPVLAPETELLIRGGTQVGYNVPTPPGACALHALEEATSGDSTMAALEALRWALAAIEAAAQAPDRGIGRRLMDWEWQQLPTIRGRYRMRRDWRAFLEEVFARLGIVPEDGALPELPPPPAESPGGSWERVSAWPYVPWDYAIPVWTGAEALVFGTRYPRREATPMSAFETGAAAGAYDPKQDRWRPIEAPPFPLDYASMAACGWVVYAHVLRTDQGSEPQLWAYGVAGNSWRQLSLPPVQFRQIPHLTTAGGTLVLWAGSAFDGRSEVWSYDPFTEQWRPAPPSPWDGCELHQALGLPDGRIVRLDVPTAATELPAGSFSVGFVVAAGAAVGPEAELAALDPEFAAAVAGFASSSAHMDDGEDDDEDEEWADDDDVERGEYDPDNDGDDPENPSYTWRVAVLEPGAEEWRTLPPAPVATGWMGEGGWSLIGRHLVCATRGRRTAYLTDEASGAAKLPYGGVLDLDTGRWAELPDLPGRDAAGDEHLQIRGSGPVALDGGWAYDPVERVWIQLPDLPGRAHGLVAGTGVWAGDRLLVFANAAVESLDREGFETRTVRVADGWSWRPRA